MRGEEGSEGMSRMRQSMRRSVDCYLLVCVLTNDSIDGFTDDVSIAAQCDRHILVHGDDQSFQMTKKLVRTPHLSKLNTG